MARDENSGNEGILGVSLANDQLRIVEGRKEGEEFQIIRVAQGRVRHPFDFTVFADKNTPRRFAEDITRLYETQDFEAKNVAFSLDSVMVQVKKLPIDGNLDVNKLEEHIHWEARQFSISPIEEFVIDFEEVNLDGENEKPEILVVIVRKKIVRFLRQIFKHTDLKLKVVDVDMFSAQRALQLNYDYNSDSKVGLIDIEDKKLHFTLLSGRNLRLCQDLELAVNNNNSVTDDTRAHLLSKELRRIVAEQQIGKDIEDLNSIYLYGEAVDDALLEDLQNKYDVRIDRANPFRKIKISTQAKELIDEARSERFMISVGAALRGVQ